MGLAQRLDDILIILHLSWFHRVSKIFNLPLKGAELVDLTREVHVEYGLQDLVDLFYEAVYTVGEDYNNV